jgi:hypothetical protein
LSAEHIFVQDKLSHISSNGRITLPPHAAFGASDYGGESEKAAKEKRKRERERQRDRERGKREREREREGVRERANESHEVPNNG